MCQVGCQVVFLVVPLVAFPVERQVVRPALASLLVLQLQVKKHL